MSVYKNENRGTWYAIFRYTDWQGNRKQKKKEGFATKREAQAYEREFIAKETGTPDMLFSSLAELYLADIKTRIRQTTYEIKFHIFDTKLIPYFGTKKINEITASDVRKWQNKLIKDNYAKTYIKTINNQLSAVFNYAGRYYGLQKNPARDAGSVGKKKADRISYWTPEEFKKAIACLKDDDYVAEIALKVLFWTGMRQGELFALQLPDIDFDNNLIHITKSMARLKKGEIVINSPKTETSERTIEMPEFLANDIKEFIDRYPTKLKKKDYIFQITKSTLSNKMTAISQAAGVKRIRVHDLRHSHASMLINNGFSALMVKERLGHQNIETTLETYSHIYKSTNKKLMDKMTEINQKS